MDGGPWWAAIHGVAKSRTWLSDFTFTFHFHALEKEVATHSNVLAWRIPGTGEPGGLPSMGSHRVGHDWSDLAAAAAGSSAGKESTCNLGDACSFPGSGRSPGEGIGYPLQYSWAFLVALIVKNMPAMREKKILEVGVTTHFSSPAWRIPMDGGSWQAIQSTGSQRAGRDWAQHSTSLNIILYLWQQWDKLHDKVRTDLRNSGCVDKVSIWLYVEVKNHFTLWELTVRRQGLEEKISIHAVWCCTNMVGT